MSKFDQNEWKIRLKLPRATLSFLTLKGLLQQKNYLYNKKKVDVSNIEEEKCHKIYKKTKIKLK